MRRVRLSYNDRVSLIVSLSIGITSNLETKSHIFRGSKCNMALKMRLVSMLIIAVEVDFLRMKET